VEESDLILPAVFMYPEVNWISKAIGKKVNGKSQNRISHKGDMLLNYHPRVL
jgi:hypothetical protein